MIVRWTTFPIALCVLVGCTGDDASKHQDAATSADTGPSDGSSVDGAAGRDDSSLDASTRRDDGAIQREDANADSGRNPDASGDPCGGSRPDLGGCSVGLFRANCGGVGGPIFACSETGGGCLWFATQCVAAGFRATDCVAGDLCCHTLATGSTWPYSEAGWWTTLSAVYIAEMIEDVAGFGATPVTATAPLGIAITVDPTIHPTTPSTVQCDAVAQREFCRATGFAPRATGAGAVTLILNGGSLSPEIVRLEIVPLGAAMLGARAFVRVSPDEGYGPACERAQTPHLDIRGTMTLSSGDLSVPAMLHGRADLTLNGGAVTVLF